MSEPADGLKKLNEYLESVRLRSSHLNDEEANGVCRLVEVLAYCGPIYRAHDPETEFIKNLIEVCPQDDAGTIEKTLAEKISPLLEVVETEITEQVTGLNDSLLKKNSNETKIPKTQLCNLRLQNIWRRLQWIAKQVDKSDETNQEKNISEIIGLKSVIDILSEGLREYYTHIAKCDKSSEFMKKQACLELSRQWCDSHKDTKRVPSTKPPNKKPKIQ